MADNSSNSPYQPWKRRLIGTFFAVATMIAALDATPWGVLPSDQPKKLLGKFTNPTGLWQGQWQMFAPAPQVGNYWFTADVTYGNGETQEWSSPYWPTEDAWTKFKSFREMNFYNRLNLNHNRIVIPDFADYLLRTLGSDGTAGCEAESLTLYANSYYLIYPENGEMPDPEELTWVTQSRQVAFVEKAP